MCRSPADCLCPDCEPLPKNCSNIITQSNDEASGDTVVSNSSCSCPICGGKTVFSGILCIQFFNRLSD